MQKKLQERPLLTSYFRSFLLLSEGNECVIIRTAPQFC